MRRAARRRHGGRPLSGLSPGPEPGFANRLHRRNRPARRQDGFPAARRARARRNRQFFPQLEIIECLGRGGMGVVYKARQPRLNRLVALKILAPEREKDPAFAGRFEKEAQALARLSHPNIVTVHDFGEAGGMYYLLMEFVDGVTLRQLLADRPHLPARSAGHRAADLRRAPIRPRSGHRPPRHQAGKHSDGPARARESRRLRPGQNHRSR